MVVLTSWTDMACRVAGFDRAKPTTVAKTQMYGRMQWRYSGSGSSSINLLLSSPVTEGKNSPINQTPHEHDVNKNKMKHLE